MPEDVKAKIEGKIGELEQAVAADDTERTKTAMEELQKEVCWCRRVLSQMNLLSMDCLIFESAAVQVMSMGQAMYGKGAEGQGTEQKAKKGGDDDGVVDAEFDDTK